MTTNALWWIMVSTGAVAALLSIVASALDRGRARWPARRGRFVMHLASYAFMSASMLAFAIRGFFAP
ncbi:MAG: hypothetical protein QOE78_4407 [Alphaproteobacteria bacterium]|nr:hypothetical protein [Alphaproteobacteria bacterium]